MSFSSGVKPEQAGDTGLTEQSESEENINVALVTGAVINAITLC
jgi:hypothetical protein